MKQPRISDFDPTAQDRELKSSMEDFPAIERPKHGHPPDRLPEPIPPVREIPSSSPAFGKRRIKPRHGFDVYEDQVEELQKLALQDRMRGGAGSMSAMVREALDDYLAKVRA
jgi:hypothetical protein